MPNSRCDSRWLLKYILFLVREALNGTENCRARNELVNFSIPVSRKEIRYLYDIDLFTKKFCLFIWRGRRFLFLQFGRNRHGNLFAWICSRFLLVQSTGSSHIGGCQKYSMLWKWDDKQKRVIWKVRVDSSSERSPAFLFFSFCFAVGIVTTELTSIKTTHAVGFQYVFPFW
jgi:hypothetical protein